MRHPLCVPSRRHRGKAPRAPRARRILFDLLEERATPAVGFGYALSFGDNGPTAAMSFDMATSVAADASGNVYVAGEFNGTVDFDRGTGVFNLTSTGAPDAFLAKYNAAGSLLWAGQITDAGPINGYRLGLTTDSGGNVYLTGQFTGTTDFDLGAGVTTLNSGPSAAAFVAKYTSAGGLTWRGPSGAARRSCWATRSPSTVRATSTPPGS